MGALAGMVTFAIYGVLITIYAPGSASNVLTQDANMPGGFGMQAMALFVTVTIPLGIAALMGWLGGRPGAMRARKTRQTRTTPSDYVTGENTSAPVSES
jgi:hypothetical protein